MSFNKFKPTSTPIAGRGGGGEELFCENAGRLAHIEADSTEEKMEEKINLDLTD